MLKRKSVFIGIDLPDIIKHKRPAIRAILEDDLKLNFDEWDYSVLEDLIVQPLK